MEFDRLAMANAKEEDYAVVCALLHLAEVVERIAVVAEKMWQVVEEGEAEEAKDGRTTEEAAVPHAGPGA